MKIYLLIGLGSALGGMSRHWVASWMTERFGDGFPVGTMMANVTGSFLIGLVAMLGENGSGITLSASTKQMLMIGVLGGYTTFSSFSLQTLNLAKDGQWLNFGLNIALSITLCIAAVWLGTICGQGLTKE